VNAEQRSAICSLETQNLRLASALEAALVLLRKLPALPDGGAALIRRAEMVLVGQPEPEH
jgi:hypothetical protein